MPKALKTPISALMVMTGEIQIDPSHIHHKFLSFNPATSIDTSINID